MKEELPKMLIYKEKIRSKLQKLYPDKAAGTHDMQPSLLWELEEVIWKPLKIRLYLKNYWKRVLFLGIGKQLT